ncbi:hypothetical protein NDU88_002641 [Pleurodeles waltl]|uniref:Uncharacterized protein n=1 Tax=Pleurodeles waltl TaxID=8319 RepID=A0AAV7Q9G3_PLEWA|nr:hypothetical protein NDU88_002641 [Pleurodeles waltl]
MALTTTPNAPRGWPFPPVKRRNKQKSGQSAQGVVEASGTGGRCLLLLAHIEGPRGEMDAVLAVHRKLRDGRRRLRTE